MKSILLILGGILLVAAGGYFAYTALTERSSEPSTNEQSEDTTRADSPEETADPITFDQPKKSAHYVSNTPEHSAILAAAPSQVSITFDFDLAPPSSITITKDGQEIGAADTVISQDKRVLSVAVADAGSGVYTVTYNACWPDGSCHDGHFQFGVGRE